MSVKLIAIGNVLMKDDGIGIEVARQIEGKMVERSIEVIYGETDFQYCLSNIEERDFIIILDAGCYGKRPGEITVKGINEVVCKKNYTQHSYSLLDMLQLYHSDMQGLLIAIEVSEVYFDFGLSIVLQEKLINITKEIVNIIDKMLLE